MNTRANIDVAPPERYKYERIRQSLLDLIDSGQYNPGDRFPSEHNLAKTFGCNYHTIRRSIGILEQQKRVERRAGSGTYVLPQTSREGKKSPQRFKASSTTTLGILCHVDMGSFGAEFLKHFHEQAQQRDARILLVTVSDFGDFSLHAIEDLAEQGACAVIIPAFPAEATDHVYDLVKRSPLPIVLPKPLPGLGEYCYENPKIFGRIDYEMIDRVYHYFQQLQFGHIAFLGPDIRQDEALAQRLAAYSRSASHQNHDTLIGLVGPDAGSIDLIVQRWEKFKGDLAVICYDDDHAIRLLMALHKRNLRIPDDVAVVGFNNTPQSVTSDPPLSTIQFDYDYLARSMIAHGLAMADGRGEQAGGDIRETLIVRESCGGRARAAERAEDLFSNNTSK